LPSREPRQEDEGAAPKYTLSRRDDGKWALIRHGTSRAIKIFETKADATAGGALEAAIGREGGSVKIQLAKRRVLARC
jgi:hypothetical protein